MFRLPGYVLRFTGYKPISIQRRLLATIHIPRPYIYDEIIAHAGRGAGRGVRNLGGRGGVATEWFAARNEAEDRVQDYRVDAQTLFRQFEFQDHGEELIAIYHSHPATRPIRRSRTQATRTIPMRRT